MWKKYSFEEYKKYVLQRVFLLHKLIHINKMFKKNEGVLNQEQKLNFIYRVDATNTVSELEEINIGKIKRRI